MCFIGKKIKQKYKSLWRIQVGSGKEDGLMDLGRIKSCIPKLDSASTGMGQVNIINYLGLFNNFLVFKLLLLLKLLLKF